MVSPLFIFALHLYMMPSQHSGHRIVHPPLYFILIHTVVLGFNNLSPHSTLFCNHPNRNFWLARFLRFYAVFQCDIQSAHRKIGKSSFTHPKSSAWFGCQKSKCADWLSDVPCMPFCPFTCSRIQILSGWNCCYRKRAMPINRVNTPFQDFSRDSRITHSTCSVLIWLIISL